MNTRLVKWVPIGLIILLVISALLSSLYRFLPHPFNGDIVQSGSETYAVWMYARLCLMQPIILVIIDFGIAVWLFSKARRDGRNSWLWCLFGIAFGILAVATYFIMDMHRKIEALTNKQNQTAQQIRVSKAP